MRKQKRAQRKSAKRGVTFLEVCVTVAVLGAVWALGYVGIQFVNRLLKQRALLALQQQAQEALQFVTRDVRNSASILYVSSDTLVMRAFNFSHGFDTNDFAFLDEVNQGTVTYRYLVSNGRAVLNREAVFNGKPTRHDMMTGMILAPSANCAETIFSPIPCAAPPPPPYDRVSVRFRLGGPFWHDSPREIEGEVMKRSTGVAG